MRDELAIETIEKSLKIYSNHPPLMQHQKGLRFFITTDPKYSSGGQSAYVIPMVMVKEKLDIYI